MYKNSVKWSIGEEEEIINVISNSLLKEGLSPFSSPSTLSHQWRFGTLRTHYNVPIDRSD